MKSVKKNAICLKRFWYIQGFCPLKIKITQCPEGFCLKIPRSNYLSLVHTYPDIFENATLIFHSGCGFRQRVSSEFGIRIRNFLNPLWIRNRMDAKYGYNTFLSGDVTRSSPVLYREILYSRWKPRSQVLSLIHGGVNLALRILFDFLPGWICHISRALRRMLSFVANIPRAVLGTRVNPDACRIRAGKGKFDLNTDTCGRGNFWIRKENLRIKKYPDTYYPSALEIESAVYVRKEK